ncbi:MAG: caspase family protein [Leptolyngbyaceae bacterium]|nr:caspase family protein [Leptolyngbyaceae bacterium]
MFGQFSHGYALLIGVGNCAEPQFSLPVTVNDMEALRAVLVNPDLCAYPDTDEHVRLLHDQTATSQGILDGLNWLQERAIADPSATIIVYYSGHGWLDTTSQQYYLIPHDFDAYDWRNTALDAKDFNASLHAIAAKRLLVILDCCHAAGMASPKDSQPEPRPPRGVIPTAEPKGMIDALAQGEGRVVFTSCRGEQKSWIRSDGAMSVYTYHLIEALQGAASSPGATEVTVFDLANHLGDAVPKTATAMGKTQTPRFETDTERFAIALLQGGKGLPSGGWDAVKDPVSATQNQVSASGQRSIAIGGSVSGSTIVTGDGNVVGSGNIVGSGNVVQRGKYNINANSMSGLHIGDNYTASEPKKGEERCELHSDQPTPSRKPYDAGEDTGEKAVFISYAWGGESEEIANHIEQALQQQGILLIRDKNDLGFKGRIKAFMERIGQGNAVIVIISEKYLKSENCMFELVEIARNGDFYDRIFPVILDDAQIYKPIQRIRYIQHWEDQIKELDEAMKTVGAANMQGFRDDIDLYTEIRGTIAELTNTLKDMNTLTARIHSESGFAELIRTIQQKLNE